MPVLFLIATIDLIGFGIIIPLLPILRLKFGISESSVGFLASAFAVGMILGGIILGILSDKFGRKKILAISLLLLSCVMIALSFAENFISFLFLRFLSGFFSGNFAVVFAAAADLSSNERDRTKNIGIISAAFAIGFVFSPALGGFLGGNGLDVASVDLHTPFFVSGLMSILALVLLLIKYKNILAPHPTEILSYSMLSIFQRFKNIYSNKITIYFSLLNIALSAILSGFQIFLGIWIHDIFKFSPQDIGFFWAFFAIIMSFTQIMLLKYFNTKTALVNGFMIYGISMLALGLLDNLVVFYFVMILAAFSNAILSPSINAKLSLQGSQYQQGMIFGFTLAISNLGRIIGPTIAGSLFIISPSFLWFSLAIICILLSITLLKYLKPS